DHGANASLFLQLEHLAYDAERLLPRRLDEAARVDDHNVGAVGIGHEGVAVLRELAQHALRIDQVLRAAQTDERVRAFGSGHADKSFRWKPGPKSKDRTSNASTRREPSSTVL